MAKVTGPLMFIDASGAFADTMVYAKWKGINYSIKIALYGRPPEIGLLSLCESETHSQTPIWLPWLDDFRTSLAEAA